MCNDVMRINNNMSFMAVFNTLRFPSFPAFYPKMSVVLEIENLLEPAGFRIELFGSSQRIGCWMDVGNSDDRPFAEATIFEIKFPMPGDYILQVFDSEEVLQLSRSLTVIESLA